MAAASLLLQAGGAVVGHQAQAKASKANKKEALRAMHESWKDISLREVQEQDAAQQTIMQADRQARLAAGAARVSAGESGVTGASVDALLMDIERDAAEFDATTTRNLDMTIAQFQREKSSGRAVAQNRINSQPAPNPWLTGLTIAGAGADFLGQRLANRPKAGK